MIVANKSVGICRYLFKNTVRYLLTGSLMEPRSRRGVRLVVEAEGRRQDSVLSLRGRRPDRVQVELMRVHPQQAGEEIQARRRILLEFVESSAVGIEGGYDLHVGVRERMLRIRPQQQCERCFGGSCHNGKRRWEKLYEGCSGVDSNK